MRYSLTKKIFTFSSRFLNTFIFFFLLPAESPTNANPQTIGSIQSVNLDSMLRHTFIPDYTVRAVTEVFYVKVKRSLYLAAKRATLLERRQKDPLPSQEQFDDEVEKVANRIRVYYK
jgi:metal transporter CNNM